MRLIHTNLGRFGPPTEPDDCDCHEPTQAEMDAWDAANIPEGDEDDSGDEDDD